MDDLIAHFEEQSGRVETIQRKLQCLGWYHGPCDGCLGPHTQEAIHRFQDAHKLPRCDYVDRATWDRLSREAGCAFYEVLRAELAVLGKADPPEGQAPPGRDKVTDDAHRAMLAGLAFSGGGVRSATFNLGILQALAQVGMLHQFDYMSTVSGGGYIGGWLSRWISLHERGLEGVEAELAGAGPGARSEPDQVKFLRQYSNFLTPKVGMFSADTWALFATYFRNTFLNLLILGCALAALLIVPRLWVGAVESWRAPHAAVFAWVGVASFLFAVLCIALGISRKPDPASRKAMGQGWVLTMVVLPLIAAAASGSVALWAYRSVITAPWRAVREHGFDPSALASIFAQEFPWATENQLLLMLLGPGLCYFAVWACGWGLAQYLNGRDSPGAPASLSALARSNWQLGLGHLVCAIGALAVGTMLVVASASWLGSLEDAPPDDYYFANIASFGVPWLLSIFGITMVLMIGLVGRLYSDRSREWWSRQGGWTIIFVLFWLALFLFSMYGPVVAMWAYGHAPGWARGMIGAGWLGTVWASLWAARNPATGRPGGNRYLKWLALFGPPLVAVAILTAIATVIELVLTPHTPTPGPVAFDVVLGEQAIDAVRTVPAHLWAGLAVCGAVFLLFSFEVDVNKFSLYMMYRNRLVRTYLGAINPRRTPHPFTGFDRNDEVALQSVGGEPGRAQRPYHIINAALNLVKGKELAWQNRKAANFAFTPLFCGYETPAMPVPASTQAADETTRGLFRPTRLFGTKSSDAEDSEKGVKLGMAMAISGAAASPSMGFHTSPALTFLMTMFNVRLGRWCGNPATRDAWRKASPPSGFYYLVKELLGFTDASSNFLYLSDGGHFENLGIYELVRRRCRLIVAVDATADTNLHFSDLGNAVRKCYTDFNIEIDIDIKQLERAADTGFSSAYCAAGKILYGRADPGAQDGTLLYIKPSLLGTEFAEIYNYHQAYADFPHQSTADQWFDETQFESYRSLGHHIGRTIFSALIPPGQAAVVPEDIKRTCALIESKWLAVALEPVMAPAPPDMRTLFQRGLRPPARPPLPLAGGANTVRH